MTHRVFEWIQQIINPLLPNPTFDPGPPPSPLDGGMATPGTSVAQTLSMSQIQTGRAGDLIAARRGADLLILKLDAQARCSSLIGGISPARARELIETNAVAHILLADVDASDRLSPWRPLGHSSELAQSHAFLDGLEQSLATPSADNIEETELYYARLELLYRAPGLVPFVYARMFPDENLASVNPPPFSLPDSLPALRHAEPRRRSAIFLHNNYYHFNVMSHALRRRGWDAVTISTAAPDHPDRQFYHGEDLNLFDPDPSAMRAKVAAFLRTAPERFGAMHFYGMGRPTFFAENEESTAPPRRIPWDFMMLRESRLVIGFMPSGCLDGGLQSSIRGISDDVCGHCVWETRPDVCSDERNGAWARKLELICDWVGIEGDWAVDNRVGPKFVRGPVVTTLDRQTWQPDLVVPADMQIERGPSELIVYHAVGNVHLRRTADRDIKGTGATLAAIERLKGEGFSIKLVFATKLHSSQVRYLQVQADVVVDQLNYGRYGANARECLMLGRPVICRIDPRQGGGLPDYPPLVASPIVNADEGTVYASLKALLKNPHRRAQIGEESRRFALRWHDSDACAARYENIVDRIRAGLPPEHADLYGAEF